MSDRKRPRLKRCSICGDTAEYLVHKKCRNCRVDLQLGRYARAGKIDKFIRKKKP